MNSLRKTIEATPEAISALKAKGRISAQVVAVNLDKDGVLTLFTKATYFRTGESGPATSN